MEYIRRTRADPNYDPDTSHVIYGLDADLIMLALATHEPNFFILREVVQPGPNTQPCQRCGKTGHKPWECTAPAQPEDGPPLHRQGESGKGSLWWKVVFLHSKGNPYALLLTSS